MLILPSEKLDKNVCAKKVFCNQISGSQEKKMKMRPINIFVVAYGNEA